MNFHTNASSCSMASGFGRHPQNTSDLVQAFAITEEDVEAVLRQHLGRVSSPVIMSVTRLSSALLPSLDHHTVALAALAGDDLEEQTSYAHAEIERQLHEQGHLSAV